MVWLVLVGQKPRLDTYRDNHSNYTPHLYLTSYAAVYKLDLKKKKKSDQKRDSRHIYYEPDPVVGPGAYDSRLRMTCLMRSGKVVHLYVVEGSIVWYMVRILPAPLYCSLLTDVPC